MSTYRNISTLDVENNADELFLIWDSVDSDAVSGPIYEALIKSVLYPTSLIQKRGEALIGDFSITTASEEFILEMENLLSIPVNQSLSLSVRKANVLIRMNGYAATPSNIKAIINTVIKEDSYSFIELYTESGREADAFTYVIGLEGDSSDPEFEDILNSVNSVKGLLEQVQPHHCKILVKFTPKATDTCNLSDEEIQYGMHTPFTWDSNDGWADSANPLEGHIWS